MSKNKESQDIEWKENWRDEYIKWIAGFANANGGTLLKGIDDKGNVKGISDAKSRLGEIPNKIRDLSFSEVSPPSNERKQDSAAD